MKFTRVSLLLSATALFLGLTFASRTLPSSAQDSPPAGQIDAGLILRTWRLKGVMFCPKPCLFVENAYPVGILEAARQPYKTAFGGDLFSSLARVGSSSHTDSSDMSGSTLQFSESHVYTFVPPAPVDLVLAKPGGEAFAVNYLSELDAFAYRAGLVDLILYPKESAVLCDLRPGDPACSGRWGNFYPRTGFVARDSEVISGYLVALRGARAASSPLGRFVLKPYPYEPRVGHYIQMVAPGAKSAIAIGGGELFGLEKGSGSKDGYYAFVHYGIFEACGKCLPARLVGPRPVDE